MAEGLLDRLMLNEARIGAIAEAVREVAALPDPVGEVVRGSTLANGLQIRRCGCRWGVVGMIYEARPTSRSTPPRLGLSGNAVILRGGGLGGRREQPGALSPSSARPRPRAASRGRRHPA
ncbi:MAG: hypothetical protein IPL37_04610 [Austwickia sp.]|nr:hypothetical protein [Austwickia sp.]